MSQRYLVIVKVDKSVFPYYDDNSIIAQYDFLYIPYDGEVYNTAEEAIQMQKVASKYFDADIYRIPTSISEDAEKGEDITLNEASVYAYKLRQFCIKQSDCLSCSYHNEQGCKIGSPIGWDFLQEDKLDFWQTDLFKDGWQEGFGMGKQELAHRVMKLFEENGV